MYHIALCDDEQAEVIKTQEMLSHYKKLHPEVDFDIGKFENTEQHAVEAPVPVSDRRHSDLHSYVHDGVGGTVSAV